MQSIVARESGKGKQKQTPTLVINHPPSFKNSVANLTADSVSSA